MDKYGFITAQPEAWQKIFTKQLQGNMFVKLREKIMGKFW